MYTHKKFQYHVIVKIKIRREIFCGRTILRLAADFETCFVFVILMFHRSREQFSLKGFCGSNFVQALSQKQTALKLL